MARTDGGALLTVQHRNAQLRLRARALRDYARIWPLWDGGRKSFGRLVDATLPLVEAHHAVSAEMAATYYESFRMMERVRGRHDPVLAKIEPDAVATSLYVTGEAMTRKAIAGGKSPQAAIQVALTRTSMAMGRHVLSGGRDTLVESSREDPRAQGWTRVASGNACAFCAMLAARGPTYSEDSSGFEAHDGCGCGAEPVYEGSAWPEQNLRYRALYEEHAKGERDQLGAMRRALAA